MTSTKALKSFTFKSITFKSVLLSNKSMIVCFMTVENGKKLNLVAVYLNYSTFVIKILAILVENF